MYLLYVSSYKLRFWLSYDCPIRTEVSALYFNNNNNKNDEDDSWVTLGDLDVSIV